MSKMPEALQKAEQVIVALCPIIEAGNYERPVVVAALATMLYVHLEGHEGNCPHARLYKILRIALKAVIGQIGFESEHPGWKNTQPWSKRTH